MVSFILCLLPALLATSAQGQTLTCNTCFGQTETCKFAPGTCQDNNVTGGCLSVAEAITLDGTQNTNFYKQCLSSYTSGIKVPISFTVGNGKYVRINIKQCNNADKCNSPVLGVPTGSTAKNGLQCPTCFAQNFALCNSSVTPCTGDETYCMDFTGFLYQDPSFSPFQAKGCATPSAQAIKPGTNLTSTPYTFHFFWGQTVEAEKIPTSPPPTTTILANTTNRPPTTATPANTTNPPPTTATHANTTNPPPTTTTTANTTNPPPTNATPANTTTTTTPATTTTTPNTTNTNKTTTIQKTTPTPTTTTTTKPTTPPKTTTSSKPALPAQTTPSGASPAVGKFSFALYLPGLTGLLLVKLLS